MGISKHIHEGFIDRNRKVRVIREDLLYELEAVDHEKYKKNSWYLASVDCLELATRQYTGRTCEVNYMRLVALVGEERADEMIERQA